MYMYFKKIAVEVINTSFIFNLMLNRLIKKINENGLHYTSHVSNIHSISSLHSTRMIFACV